MAGKSIFNAMIIHPRFRWMNRTLKHLSQGHKQHHATPIHHAPAMIEGKGMQLRRRPAPLKFRL